MPVQGQQPRKSEVAIELRHLRYVVAASDGGIFRRAAAALKVHESAISRRIRELQDEIGAALLVRHPDGVLLTQTASVSRLARRGLGSGRLITLAKAISSEKMSLSGHRADADRHLDPI